MSIKYSKGICWLDDCRIPFVDEVVGGGKKATTIFGGDAGYEHDGFTTNETGGRFTPNLLVCDDMLNDGIIREGNKPSKRNKNHRYSMDYGLKVYDGMDITGYGDTGSSSRYYDLDKWFDKVIDEIQ